MGWYDGTTRITNSFGHSLNVWSSVATEITLQARWMANLFNLRFEMDGRVYWVGSNGLSEEARNVLEGGGILTSAQLTEIFLNSPAANSYGQIFQYLEINMDGTWKPISWDDTTPSFGPDGTILNIRPNFANETHKVNFIDPLTGDNYSRKFEVGQNIAFPVLSGSPFRFVGWMDIDREVLHEENTLSSMTMYDLTPDRGENGGVLNLRAVWERVVTLERGGGAIGGSASITARLNAPMPSGAIAPN